MQGPQGGGASGGTGGAVSSGGFEGTGVLVTGGTSGIGLAVAEAFLQRDAKVVVTGRDKDRGADAEKQLRAFGEATFVAADSSDEQAVARSVGEARDAMGRIDTLVNNAGIAIIAPLVETPMSAFDDLMTINVRSPLLYAKAARHHLAERRGCVVTIASDAGLRGEQALGAYSVSKAAVVMMSKLLALDLAPEVRCNCVCPGATLPGMRHLGPPDDPDAGADPSTWSPPPLGRVGRAEDVADAVLFFAGSQSSFCTGTTLLLDGGLAAGMASLALGPQPTHE